MALLYSAPVYVINLHLEIEDVAPVAHQPVLGLLQTRLILMMVTIAVIIKGEGTN